MNNNPYNYHIPAYDPQNSSSFRQIPQYQNQESTSKTVVYHEPTYVVSGPTQYNPSYDFSSIASDNETRQFVGRGRWGRPGWGRPIYGGGFIAPFLLGSLTGATLTRPPYPYYPYPYYSYPYPYYF